MTRAMIIFPEVVDRLTQDPSKTFATDAVKFAQMWYTRGVSCSRKSASRAECYPGGAMDPKDMI